MCPRKMLSTVGTLLVVGLVLPITEAISLACGNTSQGTVVHCTCSNSGGQGVEWLVNGKLLTTCLNSVSCIPSQTGYTFSMDSSADLYFLTIHLQFYSRCGIYECRDISNARNKDSVEISISNTYLDTTWEPKEQIEPGSHTNGYFSVTSPCLFDVNVNTIEIQWYIISSGIKELYFPAKNTITYNTTSCQACKGVTAAQIQTSFWHDESNPGDRTPKEVSFVVEIYNRNNRSISFRGMYYIFVSEDIHQGNEVSEDTHQGNEVSEDIHQGNEVSEDKHQGNEVSEDKHQGNEVSEDIHQGHDKNYLPIVMGIAIAVLVIVGITLGIVIYIKRYKQKTDNSNGDRPYDDVCGMNTKSGGNNSNSCEPVYKGLKPINERGYVEMKEQAYDILKQKDSVDTKDPV